jgi:alcohol dehydrogenase YqhD (iron-dependent ADH family)
MNNFNFYTPTKIVFGSNTEDKVGELLQEQQAKKVLIHYGTGSIIRSGLLAKVEKCLQEANIQYILLGGVVPNPLLSKVYEGIELCRKENIDFILAVGGGSVYDSAKAIAAGLCYDGDVWDFFAGKKTLEKAFPVGGILTLAATGSEMSYASVITKDEGLLKRAIHSDCIRPKFSILNPDLTLTLPDYQTFCGCTDITMHTLERYLNNTTNMEITDSIAEALIRTVINNSHALKENPQNKDARWEIMWSGTLSHNDLTGCGTNGGDWSTHQMEHELGGMFDVAHGAGLAAIWGSWARYVVKVNTHRFEKLAKNVWGLKDEATPLLTAIKGIEAFENFFKSIDMPINIKELGYELSDEQINELADKCTNGETRTIGSVIKLHKSDIIEIYKKARK